MNTHNIMTSKVRNIIVEDYPYFISEIKQKDLNNTRVKTKDFTVINLIRILECLKSNDKSFSEFYLKSGFGYKRSFLNYLNLCIEFRFIEKEKIENKMYYSLLERGRIILDLFEK